VVEGMEAYIRQILSMDQAIAPMLLVKDTHMALNRTALINSYVKVGALHDPIVIHTDPATEPFLEMEEQSRPIGFQKWREFGAPPTAPGKSRHHPAKREHEFIGWLIAMHFLSALELLAASDLGVFELTEIPKAFIPAPVYPIESPISPLLYGRNTNEKWTMDRASCRTSFDPILGGNLEELVISNNVHASLDVMLPKGAMLYNTGWVLDLGDAEKMAKQQLARFGGLGFVDSKKAYYGVHASGTIRFFLPRNEEKSTETPMSSVILCESNEKRDAMACNLENDVKYSIGGVDATDVKSIDATGFSYLGKNICVHMTVPTGAKSTTKGDAMNDASVKDAKSDGFALEVTVRNPRIRKKEQACNVSHIIWL